MGPSVMKKGLLLIALVVGGGCALFLYAAATRGLSAREAPSAAEAYATRTFRRWAVPANARLLRNPVPPNPETLRHGMEHWADHCATCHANDGSGKTTIGTNLYPKAPDMREKETQSLTDGELYYIIRNGVRMTGMPAWGNPEDGENDHETWTLVLFIRHLPQLGEEEKHLMSTLNPKTPSEIEEERQEEEFLSGKDLSKHKSTNGRKQ